MSDPVVAHSDRWGVPADGDAGGGGVQHFQVCGSIRDWGEKGKSQRQQINKHDDDDNMGEEREEIKYKSGFRTCLLFPAERQALLRPAHSVDVDQVLGVWGESCEGEVVPGGRQPLVLGPPAAHHLVTDAVTGDLARGSEPVDGEGVGEDLGETQADR